MGLGLSVCMAIVRAHGGTMEAKNLESGRGIFLPSAAFTKEEPHHDTFAKKFW